MNNRQEHSDDASSTFFAVLIALVIMLLVGGGFLYFLQVKKHRMQAIEAEMIARREAEEAHRRLRELKQLEQGQLLQDVDQQAAEQNQLRILAWNVESGGNDPGVISNQLSQLGRYDIVGLSEVHPSNSRRYTKALGDSFKSVVSVTGRSDRLVLAWDSNRLELIDDSELEAHDGIRMNDVNFNHRSPLVGKFRDKVSGNEFQVVLVHLARGNAELRQEQAKGLREWAKVQELPTFGIGDFNFDYDFPTAKCNKAFEEFTKDGIWTWAKPEKLVDTNWSDRDGDGKDNYPDSCLDFMFVAESANDWKAESKVIVRDGDFPDDEKTSDHRPVEMIVD